MKRLLLLGLTAVGLSLSGQQQAPAFFEISAGIGANASLKIGCSNCCCNPCCPPNCPPYCPPVYGGYPLVAAAPEMGPVPAEAYKSPVTPAGYYNYPTYGNYNANSYQDPYGFQAPSYWYGR